MKKRILTTLLGLPLVLVFVWFEPAGFPIFVLLVLGIGFVGILEFYRFALLTGARPLVLFGALWASLFIAEPFLTENYGLEYLLPALLASALILPLAWFYLFSRQRGAMRWAWTVAGILYLGWLLGHAVGLRVFEDGREWVLLALFTTFACDTGAFLVGRTWGRRPMAPVLSPKKTWEGALGGFLAAPAAALAINALFDLAGIGVPLGAAKIVGLGILIGIFAQLGDLLESVLKRRAGVKDSGALLPGHGGALDRIDSLVFSMAVVYYYILWTT